MWHDLRRVLLFLLLLALLPLVAVFLIKLVVIAGEWTISSLTEPVYAIIAACIFLAVLVADIWALIASGASATLPSNAPPSQQPVAYCNACGEANWAGVANCHHCHAQMFGSGRGTRMP